MNRRTIFSFIVLMMTVVCAIFMGGTLAAFVSVPSLLILSSVTIGGVLWTNSLADIDEGLSDWLANRLDDAGRERCYRIFSQAANLAVVAGFVGVLIGLIQMLRNLADSSAIGPAMAVALLSLLYAVLFGEILLRAVAEDCRNRGKGPAV